MQLRQSLNGTWKWRRAGDEVWHRGTVPGSVLKDMLDDGMIEDPFWRENEYAARELFAEDYVYETEFALEADSLQHDEAELVFEGLDTLCRICLNGTALGTTADMHRTYAFDVSKLLREGRNTLQVTIHSSLEFVRQEDAHNDIFYHSTGSLPGNAAIRKAHCMFGWDWGPQLIDAGIFRNVYLRFTDAVRIEEVRHWQNHRQDGVLIDVQVLLHRARASAPAAVELSMYAPGGELLAQRLCEVAADEDRCRAALEVKHPQLWWPNGMGAHPLYTLRIRLDVPGAVQEERTLRIGLRTIGLCTAPDEWGSEFAFQVNGQKIFAMGANYIPQDSLISRVTAERYRRMVEDCAAANFNMLRVWGGGYYPDDAFYDACDENGILIWQDLMFACNVYRLDDAGEFERNIVAETQDNVRRLRHHACMALWCGNNEMESGWAEWKRLEGHHPRYKRDYLLIFERILSDVVRSCDDATPWWPSSPSSGGSFNMPSSPDHGDQHYWDVWHSGKPFTEYRQQHFRFCSEYGFQSFPGMKTIRSFTLPQDRSIFTSVMESHQKNGTANSKIFTYVADYFQYPKNMSAISYVSQLLQLKAIQYGVEFWRQNRGRCMGSLYWQLNDCWPVASWASIDYYGRWKALHYGARRFYAPRMASCFEREELSSDLTYYVHNDTLEPYDAVLRVELRDVRFGVLESYSVPVHAQPMTACPVLHTDFAKHLQTAQERRTRYAVHSLSMGNIRLSEGTTLFVKPKHFEYPDVLWKVDVEENAEQFAIHVQADGYAGYAELDFEDWDVVFSDNYFDVVSPEGKTVTAPKSAFPQGVTAQEVRDALRIRSVRDSYERGEEA